MFEALGNIFNSAWFYWTFSAIYGITVLVILGIVLSENRNPVKSLAWVTVLLLLPVVGIVLYIFFGRNIRNTRMISRSKRRRLNRAEYNRQTDSGRKNLEENSQQHIRLAKSLTGAQFYPGNDITVFTNGKSKFTALEADLRNATRYIDLQYYIFQDDNIGNRIAEILEEKARQGLPVRIIYDHVGSIKTSRKFFRRLRESGVQCYPFFRVAFPPFGTRINWRNHRKLAVIDGRVGYIGGMNVADRYIDGGKKFSVWRDDHLRVTGPAVRAIQYSFAVDWCFMGGDNMDDDTFRPDCGDENSGKMGAVVVTSGPTSQWSNIEVMFHKAIASARKRIFIQTPYLLPTEGLLKALQSASLARVDVRIMLPRRSDSMMLRFASFSYIKECLQSGIKIYLYEPGMLHAKSILIDDEIASVGSTNFDFRSFEHNFEANMFVYSKEFNTRLADIFLMDQRQCTRVMRATWNRRPYSEKVFESILRLLSPIL